MPKRFLGLDLRQIPDRLSRPRPMTLARRLTSGLVLIVVATFLLGGVPAIAIIWWQLEHQVQLRVLSAQSSTQALYAAEQRNLLQLAQLTSSRPSLCTLLKNPGDPNLLTYLDELRRNSEANALVIVTAGGQVVTSGELAPPPGLFQGSSRLPYADFIALEDPPGLGIFAVSQVASAGGCESGRAGQVITFRRLDRAFMRTLAEGTGLQQSLLLDGRRVVTSFPDVSNLPLNPDAALQVVRTRQACCTTGVSGNEIYYVGLAPLLDAKGQVVALSEVALPGTAIRAGAWKTIGLYIGLSLCVALGSAWFARRLARRRTEPLQALSEAAERMGAGDLDTPIPAASGWVDIDRLASQLDDSRRNLQQIQQIARRELSHIVHILAAAREGIVTLDEDGRVSWANMDACRLLGYDLPQLLRRHYKQVFPPAPGELVSVDNILRPDPGQPVPKRLTILNAQGSFLTLAISYTCVEPDPGEEARQGQECVLVLREVGEEQALSRLRGEFLANVAHEFRTPLSAISASTELLLEEGQEMQPGELAQLARTVNLSVIHLQALVNNLLESAILEAGVFRLRVEALAVREVVQEVAAMMLPLLQRRQQQLDISASQEVPAQLCADRDRLKQALVNLVENASKFSPHGTIILLSLSLEADRLVFAVSDCGPGLPTDRFESVFNRFFTGRRTGGAQYGIGLGLSIVKAIAEAHGGQAGAANRAEGGARVWFTIPLQSHRTEESHDQNSRRG